MVWCQLMIVKKIGLEVDYVGVEKYPISDDEYNQLNYISELNTEQYKLVFDEMHSSTWESKHVLSDNFSLTKRQQDFNEIEHKMQKHWDAKIGTGDRDAYIRQGLQDYRGSLRRKLIWGVYIIPMAVLFMLLYANFM